MTTTLSRLYLLRHSKASPAEPGQDDYERSLNERGRSDALALGRLLAERGVVLDHVVCSGAARTRQTFAGLSASGLSVTVDYDDALYRDGVSAYREAAARFADARVLLIGHNPSVAEFARELAAHGEDEPRARLAKGFPTSSLAVFRFDAATPFLEELLSPPF